MKQRLLEGELQRLLASELDLFLSAVDCEVNERRINVADCDADYIQKSGNFCLPRAVVVVSLVLAARLEKHFANGGGLDGQSEGRTWAHPGVGALDERRDLAIKVNNEAAKPGLISFD